MENETSLYWLPHYTIENGKVVFLRKYDTGISVPHQVNTCLTNGIIERDLSKSLKSDIIRQLMINGIIIPWNSHKVIKSSVEKKRRCLAIQPHSDDIAFSCGGLMQYFIEKTDIEVDILTIFSKQKYWGSPWSQYFKIDDLDYQRLRKIEDELLSKYTGCGLLYLDYEDANLRSKISVLTKKGLLKQDVQIKELLKEELRSIIYKLRPQVILLPLAIGLHRDHLIVHTACMELRDELAFRAEIYLYEDYPYCNMGRYAYFSRLYEMDAKYKLQHYFVNIQEYLLSKAISVNFYRSQLCNTSLKHIQEDVKKDALSVTYEARIHNEIEMDELLYAESIWGIGNENGVMNKWK